MNIAVDLRPLMHGNFSGVEVYIRRLLPLLVALGTEHRWLFYYNSRTPVEDKILEALPWIKDYPQVMLVRTRLSNRFLNLMFLTGYPALDKLIEKESGVSPQVFFMPDPRPFSLSSACRLVTTFHDLSFVDYPHGFNLKTRLWHQLLRPHKIAQHSQKIIAVSEFTRQRLIDRFNLAADKIKLIYEAGNPATPLSPLTAARQHHLRRQYQLPEHFIMTLSTLEPRKNLPGLVRSFVEWKNHTALPHELIIVGKANPMIFKELDIPDHPAVRWLGFVPEEDKYHLYALTDLFLFLSFYEGFGLPLAEAMHMGAAIVTSSGTSTAEIVGPMGYTVDPLHPNLPVVLEYLLSRPWELEKLKKAALARDQIFSWEKCAKETLATLIT